MPLGLLLGALAAMHQNTWVDYCHLDYRDDGADRPQFYRRDLACDSFFRTLEAAADGGWGQWYHYIMPVIALALAPMALTARYTRISILEVSRSEFIRTARPRGCPHPDIDAATDAQRADPAHHHAGAADSELDHGHHFYREHLSRAGAGQILRDQHLRRDYPMIMAMLLLVALVWSIVYLITDILYTVVEPRVRLDKKAT